MATFKGEEYKFPDEAEAEEKLEVTIEEDEDDIKIEVVDDTPKKTGILIRCRKLSRKTLRKPMSLLSILRM